MKKSLLLLNCMFFMAILTYGQIINVPDDRPTIQDGINAAVNGDTVLVAEGTYVENINYMGKAITVGSLYLMDADTSHISNTIIDGSQPNHADSGSVVFFVSGEDTTSVLSGFTITSGTGTIIETAEVGPVRIGGGIFCYNAGARISHNKIMNNHIPNYDLSAGGGVAGYPDSSIAYIIIDSNQIAYNTVSGVETWSSGVDLTCNGTIKNNDISFNTGNATGVAYGAVGCRSYSSDSRTIMIKNNTITHNQANGHSAHAGGLFLEGEINSSVIDNTISYNEVNVTNQVGHGAYGGGLLVMYMTGTTIIDGNKISNNIVLAYQGNGGGIMLLDNNPKNSNTLITNNIISYNSASFGGGISCRSSSGRRYITQITNNTIVNNTAIEGGGIFTNTSIFVINTILWANRASSDGSQISGSPIVAYSNIQDSLWEGDNNISASPLFSDMMLFHLSDSSPCINAGTPFFVWEGDTLLNLSPSEYNGEAPDMGASESDVVASVEGEETLPTEFSLSQNYPNPFNPSTTIKYSILNQSNVTLKVFDVLGRELRTLINKEQPQGNYEAEFDASNLTSGIYFYRIQVYAPGRAMDFVETKKMILLR